MNALPHALIALMVASGCTMSADPLDPDDTIEDRGDDSQPPTPPPPEPSPVVLRLNHLQAKGTHNSYHIAPPLPVVPEWNYTHSPLDKQSAEEGVRQFELDLYVNVPEDRFDVYHVPGVDDGSTCKLLVDCLWSLKEWSEQNPGHHPLAVMFELKDPFLESFADDYFALLEEEILSVWPHDTVITPDSVRRDHTTLRDAIATDGWPAIDDVRGKILFFLDNTEEHRTHYTYGETSLDGRLLFADSTVESPYAAIRVLNNPVAYREHIAQALAANMLVRTRLDAVVGAGIELDELAVTEALASGAHFLSTDVREFTIPGGSPSRCNPVTAPTPCSSADIE